MSGISVYVEDGIIIGRYNVEIVTFDIAIGGFQERLRLSNGKSYPLLIDITKVKTMDNETKTFFPPKMVPFLQLQAHCSLVVFIRIAGNFFLYFNKPPMPSRLFTDETEALKWLSPFKEEE